MPGSGCANMAVIVRLSVRRMLAVQRNSGILVAAISSWYGWRMSEMCLYRNAAEKEANGGVTH